MQRSTKAALLSGLVFPGIGHVFLKKYARALILVVVSVLAVSEILSIAIHRAMTIVDSITSGQVPMDIGAISALVSNSVSPTDDAIGNISMIILSICWLIGIVDSYRIGASQEEIVAEGTDE